MAAKTQKGNNYTSQAIFDVTESAANTLTFEKLETGLSVYDKVGWVISRVEWRPTAATFAYLNTSGDYLSMALTLTNSLTVLEDSNPAVLFKRTLVRQDLGTAASGSIFPATFVEDFSTLPGGGILTLPNPLYCGLLGSGLSTAARVIVRMYFQAIDLGEQDYFNLVQSRQLLIST